MLEKELLMSNWECKEMKTTRDNSKKILKNLVDESIEFINSKFWKRLKFLSWNCKKKGFFIWIKKHCVYNLKECKLIKDLIYMVIICITPTLLTVTNKE